MLPARSKIMDKLYGEDFSSIVYDRCQQLSPAFNELVQKVAYDLFWARPGLSLKEKSLVTITSLIVLNKEEQLGIHLRGFFNMGGVPNVLLEIINYIKTSEYINSVAKSLTILKGAIEKQGLKMDNNHTVLSEREKYLVEFSAHIALDIQENTKRCMEKILKNKIFSQEEMENIMLHQIVYCGFPCAMNGFAVLQSIN